MPGLRVQAEALRQHGLRPPRLSPRDQAGVMQGREVRGRRRVLGADSPVDRSGSTASPSRPVDLTTGARLRDERRVASSPRDQTSVAAERGSTHGPKG